jgi:hypothetical protein
MSKFYTGRDGSMLGPRGAATVTYGKVTNWTLQADLETLETTSLGESQRSYAPGVQSFSGSATLLYYNDGTNNDAKELLQRIITQGPNGVNTPLTLTLRLADGAVNNEVTFSCYITSASIGAAVGEVSSAQISFQATGALATASL